MMGFDDNPERTLVCITEDIGEILGVDGHDYDLRAGDVVSLPERPPNRYLRRTAPGTQERG